VPSHRLPAEWPPNYGVTGRFHSFRKSTPDDTIWVMKVAPLVIVTPRLRLRQFRREDAEPFSAMNADPKVMEFFPNVLSPEESQATILRIQNGFERRGFGVYALETQGEFAGIVGLNVSEFQAHFTPCVEILWRLPQSFWGCGLASEAAAAVLTMAFRKLELREVLAFAVASNVRSIKVMERIGMRRDWEGDFDHPCVEEPRLKRHVLYRVSPVGPVAA
jgi:RimJ/RimL family protein N-acetyltransferase